MNCFRAGARTLRGFTGVGALFVSAVPAWAQTDYYNTDAGRPLQVEDAYPVERRGFEVQAAPLRLARSRGGVYEWGIEPEIAFGVAPRTQIEVSAPLAFIDAGDAQTGGLSGLELSALRNLNAETSIPAFAIGAHVLLPVGNLGPDETYASVKGIMTRTFTWARFHVNAEYTFGSDRPGAAGAADLSRWMTGIAVDRAFPLHSLLIGAELFAREPIVNEVDVEWDTAVGLRYQLTTRFNIDGGIGRHLTGDDRAWYLTFGTAYAFGLPWHRR